MATSSPTSTSVLVAAVVVSSGLCFSDAFSATAYASLPLIRSSPTQRSQPHPFTLFYAPRNSLDRESEPKRRPGRPRKKGSTASRSTSNTSRRSSRSGTDTGSSSAPPKKKTLTITRRGSTKRKSTAVAAAQSTDAGDRVTSQQQRPRTRIRNPRNSENGSSLFKKTNILAHELLTKEEEQELFRRMKLAIDVQETMSTWLDTNAKARLEEVYQASTTSSIVDQSYQDDAEADDDDDYVYAYDELFGSHQFNNNKKQKESNTAGSNGLSQAQRQGRRQNELVGDESDFDESTLYNELMFGTSNQQAIEQYLAQADETEELFYADGTLFQVNEDIDHATFSPTPPIPQWQQPNEQQVSSSVPYESWLDALFLKDRDISSLSWLTDKDIHEALDLAGGRTQLRKILLEGALAREKVISSNIKLVMGIASKWASDSFTSGSGNKMPPTNGYAGKPTIDECLQEGVLGLAEAVERFNPSRGFKFSTYATFWVTNYIRRLYHRESTQGLRLPDNYYDIKRKYVNLVKSYLRSPGAEVPPMHVLAEELKVTEKRLTNVVRMTQPMLSMDASRHISSEMDGGSYNLASILPCDEPAPEDYVERSFLRQCLENAMAVECTPSERDILRLRLGLDDGEPRSTKEVSLVYGGALSAAAVRGMEKKAFQKLRSPKFMAYLAFAGIDAKEARYN